MPLLVKGKIVSGIGVGSNFMGLKWVKRQIVEKLGFEPFVGTLNLKMDEENSSKFQSNIKSREGVLIEPVEPTYYSGKCLKSRINGTIDGAVVIPLVPNYPHDQIEIIAPVNLREFFGLEDCSEITVELLDC